MKTTRFILFFALASSLLISQLAEAQTIIVRRRPVYRPPVVIVPPRPHVVVLPPAPVYVAPRRVYVAPAPVIVRRPYYYHGRRW